MITLCQLPQVIDTPEYKQEKKDKLKELISSYNHLTEKQKQILLETVIVNMIVFSLNGENMKQTNRVMNEINTGDNPPFREKLRTHSPAIQKIILGQTDKMIQAKVLVPSKSEFATNVVSIRKVDKT